MVADRGDDRRRDDGTTPGHEHAADGKTVVIVPIGTSANRNIRLREHIQTRTSSESCLNRFYKPSTEAMQIVVTERQDESPIATAVFAPVQSSDVTPKQTSEYCRTETASKGESDNAVVDCIGTNGFSLPATADDNVAIDNATDITHESQRIDSEIVNTNQPQSLLDRDEGQHHSRTSFGTADSNTACEPMNANENGIRTAQPTVTVDNNNVPVARNVICDQRYDYSSPFDALGIDTESRGDKTTGCEYNDANDTVNFAPDDHIQSNGYASDSHGHMAYGNRRDHESNKVHSVTDDTMGLRNAGDIEGSNRRADDEHSLSDTLDAQDIRSHVPCQGNEDCIERTATVNEYHIMGFKGARSIEGNSVETYERCANTTIQRIEANISDKSDGHDDSMVCERTDDANSSTQTGGPEWRGGISSGCASGSGSEFHDTIDNSLTIAYNTSSIDVNRGCERDGAEGTDIRASIPRRSGRITSSTIQVIVDVENASHTRGEKRPRRRETKRTGKKRIASVDDGQPGGYDASTDKEYGRRLYDTQARVASRNTSKVRR